MRNNKKIKMKPCTLPKRYIAIIAEKPKAGDKISLALGKRIKCYYNKIPFWIVYHDSKALVVVPSAGHLYGPSSNIKGYPVFKFEWKPLWITNAKERHLRKFYDVLRILLPKAEYYINACDYDIEGSVIGYMIILHLGDVKRAYRMKFSSLAASELRDAFRKLQPLDWDMIEAGIARHELDWLWGINISRALMDAFKTFSNEKRILSAGRVQSPTLVEAVRRWKEKNLFVPLPSFRITLVLKKNKREFKAKPYKWSPKTQKEARKIADELKRQGYVIVESVASEVRKISPPPAFNLGDLQAEASRLFGFAPMKTQEIAENLYLDALISYPRTNSQKLPPAINYRNIISRLGMNPVYSNLVKDLLKETGKRFIPVQGRKDDPAHPAIYPTGELPRRRLSPDEAKIYDLIVRRFLAAFSKEAKIAYSKVFFIDLGKRRYVSTGISIFDEGWLKYYIYAKPKEESLPKMQKGEKVLISNVSLTTEWSRSSVELSKTSLLRWMERVGIGTEGTRARIIEQLFKRGYLKSYGNRFVVTELGMAVSSVIEVLFPSLATPELTRIFEEKLENIRSGKEKRIEVVSDAKRTISKLIEEFRKRKMEVGKALAESAGLAEPEVSCIICGKRAVTLKPVPLCKEHLEAYHRLKDKLPEIAVKLSIEPTRILEIISKRREAGSWIREIALLALRNREILRSFL